MEYFILAFVALLIYGKLSRQSASHPINALKPAPLSTGGGGAGTGGGTILSGCTEPVKTCALSQMEAAGINPIAAMGSIPVSAMNPNSPYTMAIAKRNAAIASVIAANPSVSPSIDTGVCEPPAPAPIVPLAPISTVRATTSGVPIFKPMPAPPPAPPPAPILATPINPMTRAHCNVIRAIPTLSTLPPHVLLPISPPVAIATVTAPAPVKTPAPTFSKTIPTGYVFANVPVNKSPAFAKQDVAINPRTGKPIISARTGQPITAPNVKLPTIKWCGTIAGGKAHCAQCTRNICSTGGSDL